MADKKKSRIIVLSSGINSTSVGDAIEEIFNISYEDRDTEVDELEPIEIILNSGGGTVYDGFALIGAMEMSRTPVHVTILGQAQSMGLLIAACGDYRVASRHALFMYHGIAYGIKSEKLKYHEQEIIEGQRMQTQYNALLMEKTKIKTKILEKAVRLGNEVYWDAEQALKLGIIDKII